MHAEEEELPQGAADSLFVALITLVLGAVSYVVDINFKIFCSWH